VTKRKSEGRGIVAWGITGSGHRLAETVEALKTLQRCHRKRVDIAVYLSKAGYQVAKYYKLTETLTDAFGRIRVEQDSNTPFLAGALQLGKFDLFLIAPATSNTVAKIALGIADSLLTNSAVMALKAFVPVYIMPSDYEAGVTVTKLPDGRDLRLRIRREDVAHVKQLARMDGVFVLEDLEELAQVFQTRFQDEEDA
jgi:archaeoflavoprotein AfpA